MNLSNFTIQATEIVQSAQQSAYNAGNPTIEAEHMLQALLDQKNSPIEYLLKKNNVSLSLLSNKLKESLDRLPKTSSDPAQSLSRDANSMFLKAGSLISKFKDEFVTPEHLLLAMVMGNDSSSRMLKEAGLTEKGLIQSIQELRKGETVKSQTQETQFNALNKYAKNLIEMARQGKIGRAHV